MPQSEFVPQAYTLNPESNSAEASIQLTSPARDAAVDFTFEALKPGLFRTTFTSEKYPLPPFPSASKPQAVPSTFKTTTSDKSTTFTSDTLTATVEWTSTPIATIGFTGQPPLHTDLPFRSYALDGQGIAHYSRYFRGDLHVGLGEKAAPMDLSNRHFTLSATDCFGYDVHRTDPLYKHIPLLIRATPNGVVATFTTSHARGYYSVGSEMDGMWGFYKVYRQDHGGLEQYTIVGKTLQEVVKLYAELVGFPLLVPRWAMGYLGGGMKYSMLDEPRASEALMEWAAKVEKYEIPCSGFQMSSGYTVAETEPKTRNVFTWNKHRFPDPKGFCDAFHSKGIRLIANIKPYILASHPEYQNLVKAGALFTDPHTGQSAVARLWSAGGGESGEGGHIDFSSRAGFDFWVQGVKALRQTGMDCMWNDNNEYMTPSDDWQLALDHPSLTPFTSTTTTLRKDIGLWGRAMHTELHARASHDALLTVAPHERPFVLTRSATPGTMKYASSSWSGDNITSWPGLRGANALSLNAGMCLLQSYGHDIGGFEGPQPTPELLLRWVQQGIHSPRFAINCFKTGEDNLVGDVIEPWMYPEILPQIRAAIQRRYELIPYLYSAQLLSHRDALPPMRWVGWGYESDPEVWSNKTLTDGEEQYWLGDTLLVGGVFEPGVTEARIYAPARSGEDPGFWNTNAPFQSLEAGKWHTIAAPWKEGSIPVLARVGGAVPVGLNRQTVAPGDVVNEGNLPTDDWRGLEIFPPMAERSDGKRRFENVWYEDDGISPPPVKVAEMKVVYIAEREVVRVGLEVDVGEFRPLWVDGGVTVILPVGDGRRVVKMDAGGEVEREEDDGKGRRRFRVSYA
ncbi:unnamed protein product [Zymoseptoria tritici ST99CH_3D7]|uniref:alpha-glucosidase n=1 Tax=Zymoseptoria tritici (strain ST99CH_3D7) TaxID=1276538 RepID=A0A1X7RT83_ZYMT9|nr:unnamed protein product [Zymoseptoria tritici ST99CH_3D7]